MGMSDVMRARRVALGMSQGALAEVVGVNVRQIARYEADEQQPALNVAAAIAAALDVPLSELAGVDSPPPDLSGTWWLAWQVIVSGRSQTAVEEVRLNHSGQAVLLVMERVRSTQVFGQGWRGDLRLWGKEALTGWFQNGDPSSRTKGTIYFVLDAEQDLARGRWVGMDKNGAVASGWASLAADSDEARAVVEQLIVDGRPGRG